LKKAVDSADADRARDRYSTLEEFVEHFSYRKGNKMMPLKTDAHIARKFRKMEGRPTFWDYAEEEKENTLDIVES
jgi:hypothetical protein